MTCLAVRELLAEHALGVLDGHNASAVERHLAWCAACRREEADLRGAASTVGFALPAAEPDPELETRVVAALREVSTPRARPSARGRLAVASVVAAMVAVSGLGWGAVMAGRATRLEDQARIAKTAAEQAAERFANLLAGLEFADPEAEAFLGTLAPKGEGTAYGSAVTLVAPSVNDQILVVVGGLPAQGHMPYEVVIGDGHGNRIHLGPIRLDTGGNGEIARETAADLSGLVRVVVVDVKGTVVLHGMLEAHSTVPSPGSR